MVRSLQCFLFDANFSVFMLDCMSIEFICEITCFLLIQHMVCACVCSMRRIQYRDNLLNFMHIDLRLNENIDIYIYVENSYCANEFARILWNTKHTGTQFFLCNPFAAMFWCLFVFCWDIAHAFDYSFISYKLQQFRFGRTTNRSIGLGWLYFLEFHFMYAAVVAPPLGVIISRQIFTAWFLCLSFCVCERAPSF